MVLDWVRKPCAKGARPTFAWCHHTRRAMCRATCASSPYILLFDQLHSTGQRNGYEDASTPSMGRVWCCECVGYVCVQGLDRLCRWIGAGVLGDVDYSDGVPAYERLGTGEGGADVHGSIIGVLSLRSCQLVYSGVCVRSWRRDFPRTYRLVCLCCLCCIQTDIFCFPAWCLHK